MPQQEHSSSEQGVSGCKKKHLRKLRDQKAGPLQIMSQGAPSDYFEVGIPPVFGRILGLSGDVQNSEVPIVRV